MPIDREDYVEALRTAGTRLLHELDQLLEVPYDVFNVPAPFHVEPGQVAAAREHLAAVRSVLLAPQLVARTTGKPVKAGTVKAKARKRSIYLY